MNDNILNLQIFFDIAVSIGNSLDMDSMLNESIRVYLRKLNLSAAFLCEITKTSEDTYKPVPIYSIPEDPTLLLNGLKDKGYYPERMTRQEVQQFKTKMPYDFRHQSAYVYIFDLPKFGFFVLVKNGTPFNHETLLSLLQLNDKLANACRACTRQDAIKKYAVQLANEISERRQIEQELLTAKKVAEAASKAKTVFLANMSHEIRTPLNGILGMLEIMQSSPGSEECHEYLDTAVKSGKGLLAIINDILLISQIEAGELKIKETSFDLSSPLTLVSHLFHAQSAAKDVMINLNIDPSVPQWIASDEGRLRQILFNLVGNAFKFTDKGSINIQAWATPVPNFPERRHIIFSIQDTGVGISADKLLAVFDEFQQADATYSKKQAGTGLGLGICERLVEMMGGAISIHSEVGRGTEVQFSINCKIANEVFLEPQEKTSKNLSDLQPMTFLVAEDERVNRIVITRQLEQTGHKVILATNGKEAITKSRNPAIDCIIMDIQMPEMDGLQASASIRKEQLESHRSIPIIALTAYAMEGDRERFMHAGMDGYVTKPFEQDALAAELSRIFNL
ncbi:MAG: response regulator [Desulfovibrio sp.]